MKPIVQYLKRVLGYTVAAVIGISFFYLVFDLLFSWYTYTRKDFVAGVLSVVIALIAGDVWRNRHKLAWFKKQD